MESSTDALNYFLFNMLRKKKEATTLNSHVFLFKKKGLHSSTRRIVLCKRRHAEIFKAPRIKKAVLVAMALSHKLEILLLALFFNSSLPGTVFQPVQTRFFAKFTTVLRNMSLQRSTRKAVWSTKGLNAVSKTFVAILTQLEEKGRQNICNSSLPQLVEPEYGILPGLF